MGQVGYLSAAEFSALQLQLSKRPMPHSHHVCKAPNLVRYDDSLGTTRFPRAILRFSPRREKVVSYE